MPDTTSQLRSYAIHGHDEAASRAHLVEGQSFEDAALHFLEDHHPAADDDSVTLYVEDCGTGERQCFRVDLHTGETQPCD